MTVPSSTSQIMPPQHWAAPMLVHTSPWPMHGAGGTLAWGAGAGKATAATLWMPKARTASVAAVTFERILG